MRIRLVVRKRVDTDIKCVRAAFQRLEGGRDILRLPNFESVDFEAERGGRRLNLAHLPHNGGIVDIANDRQTAETVDDLAQEFKLLASDVGHLVRQAGGVAARSRQARDEIVPNRVPCRREHDWDD